MIDTDDAVPKELTTLIIQLRTSYDQQVRRATIAKIAHLATEDALTFLAGLLTVDSDPGLRLNCAYELQKSRSPTAIQTLMFALRSDPEPQVREVSAISLGLMGGLDSIPALKTALRSDSDRDVQEAALEAVIRLNPTDAPTAVSEFSASHDLPAAVEEYLERLAETVARLHQGRRN